MTLEISVVIPHFSDLDRLDRCLRALSVQTIGAGNFEVLVADNMSPEGTDAVKRVIDGRARLVRACEKGAGPARNAGVAASRATLLAFTDADCLPEPGWLAAGVAALARSDVVGGRMRVIAESGRPMSGPEAFEAVFAFDNERYVRERGFTVTANLFCSRRTFDVTGPFQVGVSEDLEWCQRARRAGFRIGYADGAVVGHPARADWPSLRRKWQRLNAESFALALLEPHGRLKWTARSMLLPMSILAHAPKVMRSASLSGGRERMRALITLARLRLWRFADASSRVWKPRNE